jgi:hypothetical protein
MKWFTEFGHLNRGDMLTSEQHRCHNEKRNFSAEFKRESLNWSLTRTTPWQMQPALWMSAFPMTRWVKQHVMNGRAKHQKPPPLPGTN